MMRTRKILIFHITWALFAAPILLVEVSLHLKAALIDTSRYLANLRESFYRHLDAGVWSDN